MLLAAMSTACGGGAGTNSTDAQAKAPRPAPASTSSASMTATSTTTTIRRPGAEVFDPGGDYVAITRSLLRSRRHGVDVGSSTMDLAVISVTRNVVSLRLRDHLANYTVSIARSNAAAAWRINLVEPVPPSMEIQLSAAAPNAAADADGSGELHDGRFTVGVEYDAAGSGPVTFDAGDRSLPRLFHYVSTPLIPDDNTPGSLENLCNAGRGGAGPAGIVYGWLYRVIAYTADGRIVSDTHVCVPFPDQNERSVPPPPPTLPEPPTIGEVWRAIQLPFPVVGANPVSRGVTGLATRLWSGGAQTAQVAATIDGFVVTGTARVVEYRFATDEGYLGAGGPGSARAPAFTHEFATKGAHTLLVSSVWRATVTLTGPGVAVPIPIDINVAVLTAVAGYPVTEVRSRLVG
jgi:hypothetical protein